MKSRAIGVLRKFTCVIAILVSLPAVAGLTEAEFSDVLKKLRHHQMVSVTFHQTRVVKISSRKFPKNSKEEPPQQDRKIEKNGEAKLSRQGKFHWQLGEEVFRFDGKDLLFFRAGAKTVTRYATSEASSVTDLVKTILGEEEFLKKFETRSVTREKGTVVAEMLPKEKKDVSLMTIEIDEGKDFVKKVMLEFTTGDTVTYAFDDPKPAKFADSEFQAPPDSKVLDL